tara:strand:+ start:92 stop:589 length:498 start_codon:yes stop_codon:yes gene_type:complete
MGFDRKEYQRQRYLKNKEREQERSRKWNSENKDRAKENYKKYYEKNREVLVEKSSKWNQENREKYNVNQRQSRDKIKNSIQVRLNRCLKKKKNYRSIEYLGCSIEEYYVYLEKQFDKNMNWDNYGTYWEIDHIIPLSKGGSFNYKNTQPLSVKENRQKSNKYEKE